MMNPGRTRPRRHSFLLLLCLGAVLTGIIGMHLWMGGHGEHTDSQPALSSASVASLATASDLPNIHAHTGAIGDGSPMAGCVGTCDAGDMAAGICMLSLIVLAMFAFLAPPRNELLRILLRRGPPLVPRASRLVPTPSLTQLCISRT
ncbi:hypothetical protein [Arthrobacter sp.]|uniref:hypothetical protein n=1 Tax=Arthrobacter sp. TaxID=1667 RepID=UPI003A9052CF